MRRAAIVLAQVVAAACSTPQIGDGGGTGEAPPGGGGGNAADAAPVGDPVEEIPAPDAEPEVDDGCYRGALARLQLQDSAAYTSGTAPSDYYGVTAAINGVPVGIFYLDLYGGIGSLPAGVTPGTYPISGDDTVWSICAVCVWASFGVSEETWVMAQSGTVRIDQVGARVTGSLEDIELVEIDIDDQPIADGCSATVDGISFDVPIE